MDMNVSFGRGDIIKFDSDYYMILSCDSRYGEVIMIQITGNYFGITSIKRFDEIVDNIDNHYFGLGDFLNSNCDSYKTKIRSLKTTLISQKEEINELRKSLEEALNDISPKNDEIISLHDEISALKDELQECYEIDSFKNEQIEILNKKLLRRVGRDLFDKTVNDLLNSKDISTVEEVSALMKIRALLYK
mgnify:CR=1 FL=1